MGEIQLIADKCHFQKLEDTCFFHKMLFRELRQAPKSCSASESVWRTFWEASLEIGKSVPSRLPSSSRQTGVFQPISYENMQKLDMDHRIGFHGKILTGNHDFYH